MSNKRRVMITIHHRDELSIPSNREQLGYATYHWGILIQPKRSKGKVSDAYDVSDGITLDPHTGQNTNPGLEFQIRHKPRVNPFESSSLLGRVMIGKIPNDVTLAQIDHVLRAVPLPIPGSSPVQNCVTWILGAIPALQRIGLVESFDVNQFIHEAFELGHYWWDHQEVGNFHNYTNRPE